MAEGKHLAKTAEGLRSHLAPLFWVPTP